MPRLKSPLFSFDASGSIGGVLTFSRVHGVTVAKRIPSHADSRTLPQVYQRWRFVDAKHYWRHLSTAQRQAYETEARPYHMTGWAYFLGLYLSDIWDQALWLPLDMDRGSQARDISGNGYHGTIFGCVPEPAVIADGAYFDHIDDHIDIGAAPDLELDGTDFTITFWLHFTTVSAHQGLFRQTDGGVMRQYCYFHHVGNLLYWRLMNAAGVTVVNYTKAWDPPGSTWLFLNFLHYGTTWEVRVNLQTLGTLVDVSDIAPGADLTKFGAINGDKFGGIFDDIRVYRRQLSADHLSDIYHNQHWQPPLV